MTGGDVMRKQRILYTSFSPYVIAAMLNEDDKVFSFVFKTIFMLGIT
jgi:hypothetical protein